MLVDNLLASSILLDHIPVSFHFMGLNKASIRIQGNTYSGFLKAHARAGLGRPHAISLPWVVGGFGV